MPSQAGQVCEIPSADAFSSINPSSHIGKKAICGHINTTNSGFLHKRLFENVVQ